VGAVSGPDFADADLVGVRLGRLGIGRIPQNPFAPNPFAYADCFASFFAKWIPVGFLSLLLSAFADGAPTTEEAARQIDSLLDSPGYVSHFHNYWEDVLRIQSQGRRTPTVLDSALATLLVDLERRGMLEETIACGLGLPLEKTVYSSTGRPFRVADKGRPIRGLFG